MDLTFEFKSSISASKSEMIRAYCLKSWNNAIQINGSAKGEDVLNIQTAIEEFKNKVTTYNCGDSALMLRLWVTRLSRLKGEYVLRGSSRLFERPHHPLWKALGFLKINITPSNNKLYLNSEQGWNAHTTHVFVDNQKSSQFLSALAINSWELPVDMTWDYSEMPSQGYFNITLDFLKKCGMEFETEKNKLHIKKNQSPKSITFNIEPDMSTAFTIAAWATINGQATIENFVASSLQPDFAFFPILISMGAQLNLIDHRLVINKTDHLQGLNIDLSRTPDLLPVLAVTCALAKGRSELRNILNAEFKESNRLKKTTELLALLGVPFEHEGKNLIIHGNNRLIKNISAVTFDPDHDHRMVMAAHAARLAGYKINILHKNSISKTAPELLTYVN